MWPREIPVNYVLGMGELQEINSQQTKSLWSLDNYFRVRVHCATFVNVRESSKVCVIVLYQKC